MEYFSMGPLLKAIEKAVLTPETKASIASMSAMLSSAYPSISKKLVPALSPSDLETIHDALNTLAAHIDQHPNSGHAELTENDIDCSTIADSIEKALPFIADEEVNQHCTTNVVPELRSKPHIKLTFDRAVTLLMLLISLLTLIFQRLPDEQLDEIIANQEQMISEMQAENTALLNAIDSLNDSIDTLSHEVAVLREQSNTSDNPPSTETKEHTENTQSQDTDNLN